MSDIKIFVRTADQTRKAELTLSSDQKGSEVIKAAVAQWSLPADTEYSLVNETQKKTIQPSETLKNSGVATGDVLDIQPVLVGG